MRIAASPAMPPNAASAIETGLRALLALPSELLVALKGGNPGGSTRWISWLTRTTFRGLSTFTPAPE